MVFVNVVSAENTSQIKHVDLFFFLSRCELLEADKEDELSQQPVHGRCGETHFLYEFFMGGKLSF